MFNLFLAVFPEIFIINATFILLIHGVVFSTSKKDDYPPLVSNVGWLGLLSVLITLLLLATGAPLLTIAHLFWNNFLRRDNFTYFCQILLLLSTAGTISMCFDFFSKERFDAFEFIVLILLSTCSMLLMISAYDLIAMYLAIELQSLCFYVIAASKRKSEFSTEAGLKYLILGAFSSGILLFGCSMIYGSTGATHFDQLAKILTGYEITGAPSSGILMGILFIAVGFLLKITAVPKIPFWISLQLLLCSSGVARILLHIVLYWLFCLVLKWTKIYYPFLTIAYCAPEIDFLLESEFRERLLFLESPNLFGLPPQSESGGYSNRILSYLHTGHPDFYRTHLGDELFQLNILEKEAKAQLLLIELAQSENLRFRREYVGIDIASDAFHFIVRKFRLFGANFNYNVPYISAFQARPRYNPALAEEMETVLTDLGTQGRQAEFYKEFRRYLTCERLFGPVDGRGLSM